MTRRALIALLLAGSLGAGLIACGSDDDEAGSEDTSTVVSGPQRGVKDVDVAEPTNVKRKPSVGVPDGKPPRGLQQNDLVEGTGEPAKTGDELTAGRRLALRSHRASVRGQPAIGRAPRQAPRGRER